MGIPERHGGASRGPRRSAGSAPVVAHCAFGAPLPRFGRGPSSIRAARCTRPFWDALALVVARFLFRSLRLPLARAVVFGAHRHRGRHPRARSCARNAARISLDAGHSPTLMPERVLAIRWRVGFRGNDATPDSMRLDGCAGTPATPWMSRIRAASALCWIENDVPKISRNAGAHQVGTDCCETQDGRTYQWEEPCCARTTPRCSYSTRAETQ